MRALLLLLAALLAAPAWAQAIPPLTAERRAAIDVRVEALLARMTLDEKVGQLVLYGEAEATEDAIRAGRVGAMMNVIEPERRNALQAIARSSRLGIPMLFGLDAVYGFRTLFPQPLAQASTWNPALMTLAAEWTAREARAVGSHWTFAPMVDMSRDPRWGRVIEGAGEDAFLAAIAAAARVRGYQQAGLLATPKHFVGYGAVEQGRDYNSAWIATPQLLDQHLPPFRAAFDAGALAVMAAFSAVNGVPPTVHAGLLRDLLKRDLGFAGFVVSDFDAIGELRDHGVARDLADAARRAMLGGVDMDMISRAYDRHLAAEVRAGRVPEALVDDAVRRVLRVKMHLGSFEEEPVDPAAAVRGLQTPEARDAALRVAREAAVLLRNAGDVLPLASSTRQVAVIGALAAGTADEPWPAATGMPMPRPETLPDALRRLAPAGTEVAFAPGLASSCGTAFRDVEGAVQTAAAAEVIIAVLGEDCQDIGEAASRSRLDLPGVQQALLERLVATGRPVVLVLVTGRPLVLSWADRNVAAILQTFHGGEMAMAAVAEILLGAANPSGRTVFSYPRSVGQLPIYYDRLPTGRPPRYGERWRAVFRDESDEPLYPFGFGLGYTRFAYWGMAVDQPRLPRGGSVVVSVTVANVGERRGQEVVQLYVRQLVAEQSRPLRLLRGFDKVELAPGERRLMRFTVPASAFGYHDESGRFRVDPGPAQLFIGSDSRANMVAEVELE